jgi:hypothetical protein
MIFGKASVSREKLKEKKERLEIESFKKEIEF